MEPLERSPGTIFVGRESELRSLRCAVDEALAGRGRLVLVTGNPGMGKTLMAQQVAAYARGRGAQVLWGRCYEGEGAPVFWPWVQIIRAAIREVDAETLRALLGAGAAEIAQLEPYIRQRLPDTPSPPPTDSPEARFRLFDSVARLLENAAQRTPIVVVVDDLHGADEPSLLLLQFITHTVRDLRLLIVGTYRDTEVRPDGSLSVTLVETAREPGTDRLVLQGLSAADVERFVEVTARRKPPAALVTMLHERTEGNPLFVGEFVQVLLARGGLQEVPATAVHLSVPRSVQAVIWQRLAPLSAACQETLRTAAVIGREFRLTAFEAALGQQAGPPLGLDEAIAARVIELTSAGGGYRFSHALIRETLYASVSALRRPQLHQQVGEALERLATADDLAELAHHFFHAGRACDDKAIRYARRAGDRALGLLAYEEAARLYELALRASERAAGVDDRERCELLLALGEAQNKAGNTSACKQATQRAAALAKALGLREHLARAALSFGTKLLWGEGGETDPTLVSLLEEALALWGTADSELHAQLLGRLAAALCFTDQWERRDTLSRQAIAMARRVGAPRILAYVLNTRLVAWWLPDNTDERLAAATELVELAEGAADWETAAQGRLLHFFVALEKGDKAALDADAAACAQLAGQLRQPLFSWLLTVVRVARLTWEGCFADAAALAQHALAAVEQTNGGASQVFGIQMFALHTIQGSSEPLSALAGMFAALAEQYPAIPAFRTTLVYIYCQLDREADARLEFERLTADGLAWLPRDQNWLGSIVQLAEACAFVRDPSRARMLLDVLTPFARRAAALTCVAYFGPVTHYLGLLSTVLSRWDDAEQHFEAALEMSERMRARPWWARTQYEYAAMLQARSRAGDCGKALDLLGAARALAGELGMKRLEEKADALAAAFRNAGRGIEAARPTPVRNPSAAIDRLFRKEGDYWVLSSSGAVVHMKDSKGMHYIARLLRNPGREFHVLDLVGEGLVAAGEGCPGPSRAALTMGGQHGRAEAVTYILDSRAKAEYRRRLTELGEELEEAERNHDTGRAVQLRAEVEFISEELAAAVGLRGRDRSAASNAERARSAVTKRIKDAIARIYGANPTLGHHLTTAIKTGLFCVYVADLEWWTRQAG